MICWEKPNIQSMVRAKLFWKDGTQMQTIKSHCLMKVGQKRKSDNTTHLPWKTIPMKLDLRQRPDFRESISTLLVDCTKNMLKKPDQEISQSIQHSKEGTILNNKLMITRNTPIRFTLALVGDIILQQIRLHPRSGSRTMNGGRHKVWIIGDLQPGLNSNFLKVEIINMGKRVASQQEMIPRISFYLVQVVVFRLSAPFNSLAIAGSVWTEHLVTLLVQTQTLLSAHHTRCYTQTLCSSHRHIALTMLANKASRTWLKLSLTSRGYKSSFHLGGVSEVMSHGNLSQ